MGSNSNYEPQRHRDAENTQIKRYGDNRDNEDVSVFTANPMKIVSFYPPLSPLSVSYFSVPLRLCGEKSHNENC